MRSWVEPTWTATRGTTVPRMMRIMEKNYFAAVDFRVAPVVAGAIVVTLILGTCILGLWSGTAAGIHRGARAVVVGPSSRCLRTSTGMVSCQCGHHTALPYPVLFFAVAGSAVVTLRQGGVRWRVYVLSARHFAQGQA